MARFKRLVVCCDGTWQASDKPSSKRNVESNVTRMCRYLSESANDPISNHEIQQVVYYQSGVGTDMLSSMSAKVSGASGVGLNENVVEAYNFLCLNYEGKLRLGSSNELDEAESDEIFLFGFSRGAYTVRALVGLISAVGILKKSKLKDFGKIYEDYQTSGTRKFTRPDLSSTEIAPEHVKIKVVGVWDTVGSLGVPDAWFTGFGIHKWMNKGYEFHNPNLASCVENAFHALALDEHRRPFSPTLWHLPKSISKRKGAPNLIQCWFPGVHINAGGGSSDESEDGKKQYTDLGEIADITFAWMVDLCRPFLDFNQEHLESSFVADHAKKLEDMKLLYAKKGGGYAQGMINDAFEGMMAAAGSRTRAPGQYDDSNQIIATKAQLLEATSKYDTNEYIHPSARIRITKRYDRVRDKVWDRATDQIALAGFRMDYRTPRDNKSSGVVWIRDDLDLSIPEYQIQGIKKADSNVFHAELSLLQNEDCQSELEMVQNPASTLKKTLPAAPKPSNVGGMWTTSYKTVLGAVLPYSMHFWENE